jgi:phage shock protein PspC (stress-responsive transcriptional regulator)
MTETPPLTGTGEPPAPRRLTRARDGRWFGGVCAGLGRYFDISPTIYRLAFAALALAGGTGILLYLAAWLVIPDEGHETSMAEQALRDHRDRPGLAVGIGVLGLVLIVALSNASFWPHPGNLWLVALLVGGGLVWWELHGRRSVVASEPGGTILAPAPRPPRGPSLFGPVVGLLVAASGVLGLLAALNVQLFDLRIALAAAVVLVGAAIAAGAASGRTISGLVGLATLLLLSLLVTLTVHVPFRGHAGDRLVQPAVASELADSYHSSIGNLTIDLRHTVLSAGATTVHATLGIGDLHVRVPAGVNVDVTADAHIGDVSVFGRHDSGWNAGRRIREDVPGATKTVVVDADVGLGDVRVDRG